MPTIRPKRASSKTSDRKSVGIAGAVLPRLGSRSRFIWQSGHGVTIASAPALYRPIHDPLGEAHGHLFVGQRLGGAAALHFEGPCEDGRAERLEEPVHALWVLPVVKRLHAHEPREHAAVIRHDAQTGEIEAPFLGDDGDAHVVVEDLDNVLDFERAGAFERRDDAIQPILQADSLRMVSLVIFERL